MKIIKYTEARLNLRKVLDQAIKEDVCVISKNSQVVIVSKEKYDKILEDQS